MNAPSIQLLAFAPHPDDAELYCGGTLAKLALAGYKTAVVDLTRGELSSRGTVAARDDEASAAQALLGLAHRENLGLPDGGLLGDDSNQLDRIVECLRRLTPELILGPYRHERHPDHEAANRLVTRGVFFSGLVRYKPELGAAFSSRRLLLYPMRYEAKPSFIVDISEQAATKTAAIKCFGSQLHEEKPDASVEPARTLIGSKLALAAHAARDAYYGSMIGTEAGEPFVVDQALSIDDPIGFFRAHPSADSYFFPSIV